MKKFSLSKAAVHSITCVGMFFLLGTTRLATQAGVEEVPSHGQAKTNIATVQTTRLTSLSQDSNLGSLTNVSETVNLIDEIVFTGSLLPRGNYESNAPIAKLEAVDIAASNPVALETILWELPQVLGGNQTASAGKRSKFPTIDLRGLGTNRTLTLIDGARMIPGSADGGSVDLNYVPHGFIENIEILTGGASTAYGSDAIAGVINIKTKDNFNGFELGSSFETSHRGDAEFENINATFGTDFSNSSGRLIVHADVSRRGTFKMSDRRGSKDWNCEDWGADGVSGGIYPCRAPRNNSGVVATPSGRYQFSNDGEPIPFLIQEHGKNDAVETYLQHPLEREIVIAKASWNSGPIVVSGTLHWSNSLVEQRLQSPWWDTNFEITFDENPFLSRRTVEQWMALDPSIGIGAEDTNLNGIPDTAVVNIARSYQEAGPTIWKYDNTYTQFRFSVSYELSEQWLLETTFNEAKIRSHTSLQNGLILDNLRQSLLLDTSDPSNVRCLDSSNGCIPANIFGSSQMSVHAQDFITHDKTTAYQNTELSVAGLVLTGNTSDFFEMPNEAGPIGVAFGIEYLRSTVTGETPRKIEARNYSVIRRYEGVEPSVDADLSRKSVYAELLIPMLQGVSWASFMELELGARYAEEEIAGSNLSSKAALSWFPVDDLQIRFSYNRSIRAPAPLEIFGARPNGRLFGKWMVDPCSAEGASIQEIDVDRCVENGVPREMVGSTEIDLGNSDIVPVTYSNNIALTEEKGSTFTSGIVWTPYSFNDLSFSIDYFEIDIDDYVVGLPGGVVTFPQRCLYDGEVLGGGFWARVSNPSPAYCQAYTRDSMGKVDLVLGYDGNYGDLLTRGFDLGFTKSWDLKFGTVSVNYMGTLLEEQTFSFGSSASSVNCAGKMNSDFGGQNCIRGVPAYKHRATVNLIRNHMNYQLAWRRVGKVRDNDSEVQFAVEHLSPLDYLDLSLSYASEKNWELFAGVSNLLDRLPQNLGDNAFEGNTLINMYDVIGRSYFARVTYRL